MPTEYSTLTHRTEVAPDIYLVSRVQAEIRDGQLARTTTTHERLERGDGSPVYAMQWPALSHWWLGLRYGSTEEPIALREAADEFVGRLERELEGEVVQ